MAAPTFIASYTTTYNTSGASKNTNVTTQAGDVVVVYGGGENEVGTINTPSGNSISFTLQESIIQGSSSTAYIWTGIDSTGGSNWSLSATSPSAINWGFTCLVFRDSDGIGSSNSGRLSNSAPSISITTTQDNSAIVFFAADWDADDGSGRTWRTINGITPTSGNGLERTYVFDPTKYTVYGGYYNDAGSIGTVTAGISSPTSPTPSMVVLEVKGADAPPPEPSSSPIAWFVA
jgi:hypothetical protein